MELFSIKEYLNSDEIQTFGNSDATIDIRTIKLLTKDQTRFHKNILYLGPTELLPDANLSLDSTILCYGKSPDPSVYQGSKLRILYMENEFDCAKMFNDISDRLQDIQKINTALHLLINAFFTEQGLQYLTDVAHEVFGNPLFVVDTRHKYLAMSAGTIADTTFASEENRIGYINAEGLAYLKKNRIDERIREQNAPIYFVNPLHNKGMMVDAITINNIEVGHVMLYEQDRPFGEFDSILLHRTSRIISMELQKDSFIRANKGFMYSYFLAELLDNPLSNYSTVAERLETIGYDLKEDQYILVIPAQSYRDTSTKLDIIVEQLRYILPHSIYVIYENSIVFLISRNRKEGITEHEQSQLTQFLTTNELTAGMSNFFGDLRDARRFYKQAVKSIDMSKKMNRQGPIHYYSDYYLYHIFEMCEQEEEIRFFIHPGMMRLLQYDETHGTDFLTTLYEYLESPGQPTQIAKRLHIHKNTLLYRMDKIRSIMDCKIETGDEFMSFGLSYKIMQYLKLV
ncbi:PucR family transcriptional regulator [Konateibacter massiliensis]|uniref:PucR family transcriptional regulator n=1 Tax=Konateibacter massiliensis TaxID=2002841 RepID=UPI000C158D30|nr:helix-turn-helix domain-containing protein [Konateibacter massiliensis]